MAMTVDELHREAMTLPPEEREELAMRLLQEARSDPEIEKVWVEECRRRLEDSLRNPWPPRDGFKVIDEIFERIRALIPKFQPQHYSLVAIAIPLSSWGRRNDLGGCRDRVVAGFEVTSSE